MTRALGDSVMARAGVIPTPEVTQLHLSDQVQSEGGNELYRCLVLLASDGIFDVMSNEDAIHFLDDTITDTSTLDDACSGLVQEARDKWQAGLPLDVKIDDTSAVVTSFNFYSEATSSTN